mgnify:CR=1 FL=1
MRLLSTAFLLPSFLLLIPLTGSLAAQQPDEPTIQAKRQFVRANMIREFADSLDASLLQEIDAKVAAMTPQRIDQLVEIYQKRAQAVRDVQADDTKLEQIRQQAQRDALIAQYQQRLAAARSGRNPGFAPVITTLPSGAHLGASAVVSPDRRYVRMNLQPFFSNVGPVQTFTFQNPTPFQQRQQVQIPFRPN